MTDALEKQITGEPVTVTIGGVTRRLEYRFAAILAYQDKTGDSLFSRGAFAKIDLGTDPRRWLSCLWAGLHEKQPDGTWKSALSFDELSGLIGFDPERNGEISLKMVQAMSKYFPAAEPVPNAAAPGELAQEATLPATTSVT